MIGNAASFSDLILFLFIYFVLRSSEVPEEGLFRIVVEVNDKKQLIAVATTERIAESLFTFTRPHVPATQ